jgi:type IV secretion system protein VirB7
MKKLVASIVMVLSVSACSSAGPYVTNISSDGNNGINIEKCKVHFNSFTGNVSTGECTSQSIKLSSK